MIDNITGTLYPSGIPPITSLELLADTAFMVITASGELRQINRTEMYTNMAALGLKGDKGDKGDIGNRGPAGPQGIQGDAGPAGPAGPAGVNGTQGPAGANGANGWIAVTAIESRGNDQVIKVVDWTGGGGTKPTVGIYVSPTGFTSDINLAANIRGLKGDKGDAGTNGAVGTNGWSPLLRVQVDSGRKFLYVYDWIGGTGTKPTTVGFVTETGISNTASSGGFDYDVSSQLDLLNVRVDDINVRLVTLEDANLNLQPFANSIYFSAINMSNLTPPVANDGDTYIIPLNATGDWASRFGYIAHFTEGAWEYYEPVNGYLVYDKATKNFYVYNGTAWVDTQKVLKDSLANKVDKVDGKTLTTNDFTNELKEKLETIDPNPTVVVEDNLDSTSATTALSANQGRVLKEMISGNTGTMEGIDINAAFGEVVETDTVVEAVAKLQKQTRQLSTGQPIEYTDLGSEGYYGIQLSEGTVYTSSQNITLPVGMYRFAMSGTLSGNFQQTSIFKRTLTDEVILSDTITPVRLGEFSSKNTVQVNAVPYMSVGIGGWAEGEALKYIPVEAKQWARGADYINEYGHGGRSKTLMVSNLIHLSQPTEFTIILDPVPTESETHIMSTSGTGFLWVLPIPETP